MRVGFPGRTAQTGPGGLERDTLAFAALDAVPVNIFLADTAFHLTYMNAAARETTRSIEKELQTSFGVAWDQLVGASIHRFHRDPAKVERILMDRSSFPHQAQFSFGAVTLQTSIQGLFDAEGRCRGYVVAWSDVSRRASMAAAAAQISGALEASSLELESIGQQMTALAERTSTEASAASLAAEQMSDSISEIASSAAAATSVAQDAVTATREGQQAADNLVGSTNRITEVVNLIASIAAQTNILALNATIEAARAGASGKGFSVVANEVKELAKATGLATADIAELISRTQADANAALTTLRTVLEKVDQIAGLQSAIGAAVEEQSAVSVEMAHSISSVAKTASETASGVGRIAKSSAELSRHATQLGVLEHD